MRGKTSKTIIILISFLIIELNIVFIITANTSIKDVSNNVIIVSKFGGDYKNIQDAIDNAIAGSIISVKSGFYSEIIDIYKPISLIGENKFTTKINPISDVNKYAIRLETPGIVIKNLSITNGASGLYSTGIRINAPRSEIINCNLYNNPIGIAIFSSENVIDNCNFWNCKDEAIALIGTDISNCDSNIITNCSMFNNCDGIELQYSSKNIILNCSIFNNTHAGIDGIISSNNNNLIRNCKIYNNKVNGIYLSSSSFNRIIGCSFWGNIDGDFKETTDSIDNSIIDDIFEEKSINDDLNLIYKSDNQLYKNSNYQIKNDINTDNNFHKFIEMISNIIPIIKKIL
jgi:parallel beta-helix repeat protein